MSGVLFRVDVGPGVGLGHVHRNLGLAEALRDLKIDGIFVLSQEDRAATRVTRKGFQVETLSRELPGQREDCSRVITTAKQRGCTAAVVDSYVIDEYYIDQLRSSGLHTILIEDEIRQNSSVDLLINTSLTEDMRTIQLEMQAEKYLCGSDYVLLRSEFWNCPGRTINETVDHVLLTVGGDDWHKMTESLMVWLDNHVEDACAITVVVGPFFDSTRLLEEVAEKSRHKVRLITAPDCLFDLMTTVDLVVCGGGQTAYELAATGTPAIALDFSDNQTSGLQALVEAGTLVYGGRVRASKVPGELVEVMDTTHQYSTRQRLSRNGQKFIDGQGAAKVAHEIARML